MVATSVPTLFGLDITKANYGALVEAASENGWKFSGAGKFSRVLVKGDQALKIFTDASYLCFLEQIVDEGGGGHLPRLLSPVLIGDGLNAVFLERLEHVEDVEISRVLDNFGQYVASARDQKNGTITEWMPEIEMLEERCGKAFTAMLDIVCAFAHAFHFEVDMFSQNFLRRPGTGELVISDPVCP